MTPNSHGLVAITQSYTTMVKGRVIVIHDVPMLQDPETQEVLISPETAEKLYDILSHPEQKTGVVTADVYVWEEPAQATT